VGEVTGPERSAVVSASPPSWVAAGLSLACAVAPMGAVVASSERPAPVVTALVAIVVAAMALFVGRPVLVAVASFLQVGAIAWWIHLDDADTTALVVVLGVALWLSFELAMTSLDVRGAVSVSSGAVRARALDLMQIGALGGVVGVVALFASRSGPTTSALALRVGGFAAVALVVAGVILLSRRPRRS
jgi:hypothetical protein